MRKKSVSYKNRIHFGDGIKPAGAGDAPCSPCCDGAHGPGRVLLRLQAARSVPRGSHAFPMAAPPHPAPYSWSQSARPHPLYLLQTRLTARPLKMRKRARFNPGAEAGGACPGAGGADLPYFQLARPLPVKRLVPTRGTSGSSSGVTARCEAARSGHRQHRARKVL